MPNYQETYPIACILLDEHGRSDMRLTDTPDQCLILEIKNVSGRPLQFNKLKSTLGPDHYHVAVQFRKGVLAPKCLMSEGTRIADAFSEMWEMTGPVQDLNSFENFYLRYKGNNKQLEPGQILEIHLDRLGADPERGAFGTRVTCNMSNLAYVQHPKRPLEFERTILLGIGGSGLSDFDVAWQQYMGQGAIQDEAPTEQPVGPVRAGFAMSFSHSSQKTKTVTTGQRSLTGFGVKVYGEWALIVPRRGTTARLQVLKKVVDFWQPHEELDFGGDMPGGDASISEDWLVMSAVTRQGLGKVIFYRLEGDSWVKQQTVSGSAENDWFGEQVAISGPWALFGAPKDNAFGKGAGSASVFHLLESTWSLHQTLGAKRAQEGEQFGKTVAIDEEAAVVGSDRQAQGHSATGSGHLFQLDEEVWKETQQLIPGGKGAAGDLFGFDMSMREDQLLAGAQENGLASRLHQFQQLEDGWVRHQVLNLSGDLTRPDMFSGLNAIGIEGIQDQSISQQNINLSSFLEGK